METVLFIVIIFTTLEILQCGQPLFYRTLRVTRETCSVCSAANLSLIEYQSKIYELQEQLSANYSKQSKDESFLPPMGSTLNLTKDSAGFMKQVVETKVDIHMTTDRIVKMDIDGQCLVLVVDEFFLWRDEKLSWKHAADDACLPNIIFNANKIWTPNIYPENILNKEIIRDLTEVKVYCDGVCESSRRMQYTIPCTINVEQFPFDRHNCSLRYTHPDNSNSRIYFNPVVNHEPSESKNEHLFHYQAAHLEWGLISVNISVIDSENEDPGSLEYILMLKRQATFYFTVLILPCIILNVLSMTVFTMPVVDSSRTDFVLALILTYFVLIMIVVESSPPSGNQIPLLGLYIIMSTAVVGSTYGMSMILIEMHEHCRVKKQEMPRCLSRFLEHWCCLNRRYKLYKKRKARKEKNRCTQKLTAVVENGCNDAVTCETSPKPPELCSVERVLKEGYKWKLLGKILNFVFFLLVSTAHVIVTLVAFYWY